MTTTPEARPPLERAIDDYLDGYVLEGDDRYHLPTEHEKLIVKDAIMGLLEEPEFRAALAQRQQVPDGWQPIETAPRKDQMRALVAWPIDAGGHYVEEAWFDLARDQWWPANTDYTDSHGSPLYPSHWMPLPAAPALTAAPSAQAEPQTVSQQALAVANESARLAAELAAQAEPQEPLPEFLTAQDKSDLLRIEDCFSDGEGYDLPRERMARLAELGVIRHNGGGVYSITAFGMYCTGAWPVLPLKTAAESNAEEGRMHAERMAHCIGKQEST